MADITWFAYDVASWDERVRSLRLSFADEGVLHRLVRGSWSAAVPCTLVDDPDEFARILGANWKKALPVLRTHWTPLAGSPGVLRCEWLWEIYQRSLEKHLSYQSRGKLGGRPRSSEKAEQKAEVIAGLSADLSQSTTEAGSCAPTEHTATSPTPDGGLAPVGAAPLAAGAADRPAPGEASASSRFFLPPLSGRAGQKPGAREPGAAAIAEHEAAKRAEDEYFARLRDRAERWLDTNPDRAKVLESEERMSLGFRLEVPLTAVQQTALRENLIERVREEKKWPSCREWLELERARIAAESEAA